MESNIIGNLRRPEELDPEGLLGQLDELFTEYAQLQEHKATIESINKEGAKFVQDAKVSGGDEGLDVLKNGKLTLRRLQPEKVKFVIFWCPILGFFFKNVIHYQNIHKYHGFLWISELQHPSWPIP